MTQPGGPAPMPPAPHDDIAYPRPRYAWYVLGVLTLVYVFSFLDRQILNLLVAPIRRDLHISDTQMSLLSGFAFALFYVAFGIPLGRIADSRSRTRLIAAGFATWSVFTAACGLAGTYTQLAIMRMGVGIGEASLGPAAYSLITDYFPPNRRARAQGIYNMGIYVGSGVALIAGGLVAGLLSRSADYALPLIGAVRSWQVVFIVIGIAGLLFVPVMLSVKEPIRQNAGARKATSVPFNEVLAYLRANFRTYGCHNLGLAMLAFSTYGSSAWMPTYVMRHFHWTAGQVGVVHGTLSAVFGALGTLGSGWVADKMAARGHRDAYMRTAFWVAVLWYPTGIAMFMMPTAVLTYAMFVPTMALAAGAFSIGPAALMQVTPQRMRGQAGAIYLFVINLIGLGVGPTAVALCTDYVFRNDNMVGYSLLIVTCAAHASAAVCLWYGRQSYVRSLEAAKDWVEARAE